MRKFGKGYNVKISLFVIAIGLFLTTISYSDEVSCLRVQVDTEEMDSRSEEMMYLQLNRKQRIKEAYQKLVIMANGMEKILEDNKILEDINLFKEWLISEGKNIDSFLEIKEQIMNKHSEMKKKRNELVNSLFERQEDEYKYFINFNGDDYFKFQIPYNIRDNFSRIFSAISHHGTHNELAEIEEGMGNFFKEFDIYTKLLEHIKAPTEDVLELALTITEDIGPEDTYRFLALYFNAIVKGQEIKIKEQELYAKVIESANLILEEVNPEKQESDEDTDAARILEELLKDEIGKIKDLEQEDILKKTDLIQSTVRIMEDMIDRFYEDEHNIKKFLDLGKDDIYITFTKYAISHGKTSILENLRIIKTILAEITPGSIKAYIESARSLKANQLNL